MAATVTVAGAGVLGLTTALALADAGFRVTICDPAAQVSASAVAAGMLAPVFEAVLDPAARPHFDLLLAARDLWSALAARTGIELDRSGAVAVGESAWLEAAAASMATLGPRGAWIGGATARALAPGLSAAFDTGLLTREDWRVSARPGLSALRRAAESAGVLFRAEPVEGRGTEDLLVVATGFAARGAAPELKMLEPIRGGIL